MKIFPSKAAGQTFFVLFFGVVLIFFSTIFVFNSLNRTVHFPVNAKERTRQVMHIMSWPKQLNAAQIKQLTKVVHNPFVHTWVSKRPLKKAHRINLVKPEQMRKWLQAHPRRNLYAMPLENNTWLNIWIRHQHTNIWLAVSYILLLLMLLTLLVILLLWSVKRLATPVAAQIHKLVYDRTQMLAAISHDLRTPITRLKLRAEYLEDTDQYEKILADLKEMEQMLSSVLVFARDDAHDELKEKFDLNALLDSLCSDMVDAGMAVTYQSEQERVAFFGRMQTLKRAFTNIINNAIQYGNVAKVRLIEKKHEIIIEVDDEGPGIPAADLSKVFTPFYRVEQSRSRETGGAGLGLVIAKDAILSHGGDIKLINLAKRGLRVVITLPI